jgi:hypothetical protein
MNEREIFEQALDHADPAQRAACLDRASGGDAALRARIDGLLASHSSDTQFLNVPALEQIHPPAPTEAKTISVNSHGGLETVADETKPEDSLSDGDRAVLLLHLDGLSHADAAEVLGLDAPYVGQKELPAYA